MAARRLAAAAATADACATPGKKRLRRSPAHETTDGRRKGAARVPEVAPVVPVVVVEVAVVLVEAVPLLVAVVAGVAGADIAADAARLSAAERWRRKRRGEGQRSEGRTNMRVEKKEARPSVWTRRQLSDTRKN